jgi:ADP-ribose pyrophosphatase YjhB (NUDIX family)
MTHPPPGYCPNCGTALEAERGPGGRAQCPRCHFVRYENPKVATGVVAERDGRILLVRRNHEPMLGKWSFPSGFVDAGEAVVEAAVRETFEEAGVEVRIDRLLGVYSARGNTTVFIAYAGTIVAGEPAAGDEAFEVGLFAPDALPPLAFPHDPAIMDAWRAGATGAH